MSANTLEADVNEILLGYYALGGTWKGFKNQAAAKGHLNKRKDQIGEDSYMIQAGRAKKMAEEALGWAKSNGYRGKVRDVWWTARRGDLGRAVGYKVDSDKNPTDTLLRFSDGKFLGLSAKATKRNKVVGFKNPGLGTVDRHLGTNLEQIFKQAELEFADTFNLDVSRVKRKSQIKANRKLVSAANVARDVLLETMRKELLTKMKRIPQKNLQHYLIHELMDASTLINPGYIKVTGKGTRHPYSATVVDPFKNDDVEMIQNRSRIKIETAGKTGVGVSVKSSPILKIRPKFRDQAMASPMNFSVDQWKTRNE